MAKFKYRMQNVLDIKWKLEDAAKMEFAEATSRVYKEEEKLKIVIKRKEMYEAEGKKLRCDTLNVARLKENTRAVSILDEERKEREKQLEMARKVQELAREKLQNAMQERKTQEKLYENAFEDFKKEVNAKESKEVDELTSYTYGKNRRQESGE